MRDLADCALIGGTAMERIIKAAELRRAGATVFTELVDRKRQRMVKRAAEETWPDRVFDISDPVDLAACDAVML